MKRPIFTFAPEQISRFLVRHRRGETLERYHPQLDGFLQEILARADQFVPSGGGAILLDDPKAKMFDLTRNTLTVIAAFGEGGEQLLGRKFPCDEGLAGAVYSSGAATRSVIGEEDRELLAGLATADGLRSLLGVPLLLGNSICGVILLVNREGRESYSEGDHALIDIFAAYISSSIQNTLDGIRAKELAQRDDLTGLYNDRYLHYRLRSEIKVAHEGESELSLLFMDLDCFKQINDRFGHLEGSRTLHMVGILLEGEIPPEGVAARYGGDEFLVILPGFTLEQARQTAGHLRDKIASTAFALERPVPGQERLHVTASLGVASLRDHVLFATAELSARANALIRAADEAMYVAKEEGRNRVAVAHSVKE